VGAEERRERWRGRGNEGRGKRKEMKRSVVEIKEGGMKGGRGTKREKKGKTVRG
jgi:hypothetical protein